MAGSSQPGTTEDDRKEVQPCLIAAAGRLDLLAEENWQAAAMAAEAIEKRWAEPDAGIWELEDRHWTHSRLACVSGLRSLAAAAATGPPGGPGHAPRPVRKDKKGRN